MVVSDLSQSHRDGSTVEMVAQFNITHRNITHRNITHRELALAFGMLSCPFSSLPSFLHDTHTERRQCTVNFGPGLHHETQCPGEKPNANKEQVCRSQ